EKEVARTDYLTGIANRRFFFKLTNIEIKRSRRYKTPFTFVYLDLDNFKTINDCLGHHTGDTLLRTVAHTIKKNIRSTDFAARLGGDEFAILLTGTEATSAHVVIQKLQSELLHVMRQNKWPVTFSIGILTLNGASTTIDEVMKKADILMYSAKQNGKNMIKKEAIND
ncbi:MAG: GGDEF domain-containing protein, partial [Thermodesulfobacteriota bacterium]|nr:GGDEF domain-containing protein [Thermodesulfobacteriota bacterium]